MLGTSEFDETLVSAQKAAKENGSKLFVFAYGAEGEDGNSWCPDCVDAKPVIEGGLAKVSHAVVYASCPRDEYKKGEEFPYRSHKAVKLQALPQLNRVSVDTLESEASLVENDCKDAGKVDAVIDG